MTKALFASGSLPPCPASFNLASYVLGAGDDADVALVVSSGPDAAPAEWRYADLRAAVHRSAGGLAARGVRPGDRVLLRIGNDPAFAILFLAAITLGAVPVPTSALLTPPEVHAIASEITPRLTCFAGGLKPISLPGAVLDADEVAALMAADPIGPDMGDPNRLAYMIYTSGTSGRPRAVMHAHRAIWARRMMWDGWYGLRADDRMLHAGAFNWTYTLGTGLLDPWSRGATAMIYSGPADRSVWGKLAQQLKPSIFAAAPGVYRQILTQDTAPFKALRHGLSAGEKLSPDVRAAWQRETGTEIYEALGMSECSTFISHPAGRPVDPASAGYPQQGRRIAVLGADGTPTDIDTPGQLAVHRQDPGLMLGYFNQPEETAARFAGDWFATGDTVSMAQDGAITYLGRDDDMMNAGGYRVSPLEVECALLEHDGVEEAAAAEVEVKPGVTVIGAFFVGTATPEELQEFCAARLAKYKQPRMFVPKTALPRGANGKLRRKDLRSEGPT